MTMATISLIELIWTVPAVVGLVLTSWQVRDIWGDRQTLHRSRWNGLARLQVEHWLRSELLVLVIHISLTSIGVVAMTQPPSPATNATPSVLGVVLTAVFVAVPMLLMIRSAGDRVVRQAIRRYRP